MPTRPDPGEIADGRSVAPLRVCFVLASNTWGGAEIHTVGLVNLLASRGHSVVIVELDDPVIAEHRGLLAPGVELCSARLAADPARLKTGPVYRFLRPFQADVGVFVKGWPAVGTVGLDLACRRAFRGRFLTIEQSTPPRQGTKASRRHLGGLVPGIGLWWYAAGLRLYVRSIFPRRIVAVSDAIAADLRQYGFPASKLLAIPHGVDAERFAPDPEGRASTRAYWGVPHDAVVFGSVARLSNFHKGLDVAVECFGRLCAANPARPLWYVVVGSGPDEVALKQQAESSGWGSRILFAGGTERPWEAHRGIDVFLMPSRFEGLGLSLLEAMASGCCPVVMGVGGIRDIVTDPTLGWVAPAGDREAFQRGMQAALDAGPDGRAAMGTRARQHVLRHFRAATQYGKLADLIERC